MTSRFPTTSHSLVSALAAGPAESRRAAFGTLVQAYWKPVYAYTRLKWRANREDAEDLTQEFFARALEKDFFAGYDPGRARFRTFLRTCLDRFLSGQHEAATRLKRGGHLESVSLDFASVEAGLGAVSANDDPEAFFRREWARALMERAVGRLRELLESRNHLAQFSAFEKYDLYQGTGERPTYQQIAAELGVPVTQVTNFLAAARREFRTIVLELMREEAGSEAEFRQDARDLLGFEPR